MMSTEFSEIIPEPFTNPCASYDRNAEDYINEVVIGCHSSHTSLYNSNNGYYAEPFDTDSNHHSLLLEDPATGQNQILEDSSERGFNGRSSYSYEPNVRIGGQCIKIVVKEPNMEINCSNQSSEASSTLSNHSLDVSDEDGGRVSVDHDVQSKVDHVVRVVDSDGVQVDHGVRVKVNHSVQVKVDNTDGSIVGTNHHFQELTQSLLRPKKYTSPASSIDGGCDNGGSPNGGSPTPTPSYNDVMTTPTIEYPGREEMAFRVRGGEVAVLEESCSTRSAEGDPCKEESYTYHNVDRAQDHAANSCDQRRKFFANSNLKSSQNLLPLLARRRFSECSQTQPPLITLSLPPTNTRKFSDPVVHVRRQRVKTTFEPHKQRCLSDSEAPAFLLLSTAADEYEVKSEEGESSALGCDSGFHDERSSSRYPENLSAYFSSPRVSLHSSDVSSFEESPEPMLLQQRIRRLTPHVFYGQESSQFDDASSLPTATNPGTMVHPRERTRRSLMKHFSQGSIGGGSVGGASIGGTSSIGASSESPSLSSLLESQSNLTSAADILSSLGFDDFDSPQLVPDRFIPVDLEYLRPSAMKVAFIEQTLSPDPPKSPDSLNSGQSSNQNPIVQQRTVEPTDLPLGATAENFLPCSVNPTSPISTLSAKTLAECDVPSTPPSPSEPLYTDTAAIADFTRSRVLETVPEETASDLSPSPRWLSPRVSIDHSVHDFSEGNKNLGANLIQKVRKRSLPTGREGYKLSIGSVVESDAGDSIHLSVTSYDDEIAAERERERERENYLPGVNNDDIMMGAGRRRRRGVYTPPQTLLSWLSTQKTINEEVDADPDELPWPFNEQARLRKSLTEIHLARISEGNGPEGLEYLSDDHLVQRQGGSQHEMSLSPISTPNTRLSPQPAISEGDEEDLLDDLDLEDSCCSFHNETVPSSHDTSDFELRLVLSPTNVVELDAPLHTESENGRQLLTTSSYHQSSVDQLTAAAPLLSSGPSRRLLGESRPPMLSFNEFTLSVSDIGELATPIMPPDSARSDITACITSENNLSEGACSLSGSLDERGNVATIRTPIRRRSMPFSLFLDNCTVDPLIQPVISDKDVSTSLPHEDNSASPPLKDNSASLPHEDNSASPPLKDNSASLPPEDNSASPPEDNSASLPHEDNSASLPPENSTLTQSKTPFSTGSEQCDSSKIMSVTVPRAGDLHLALDPYKIYSIDSSDVMSPTNDNVPVMSSRRRRKPFLKQQSFDGSTCDNSPVSSRRQAVFGEAPSQHLLASTSKSSITENRKELGKWMLL